MLLKIQERAFLRHLGSALKRQTNAGEAADTLRAIRQSTRTLLRENRSWSSKLKGDWLGLCCSILASYRQCIATCQTDPDQAYRLVDRAFFSSNQWIVRRAMRLIFSARDTPEQVNAKIQRYVVPLMRGGITTRTEQTEDKVELDVTQCHFHGFFDAAGEPGLTRVLCRYDRIWMSEVSGITGYPYARPETRSTGSQLCRFQFLKDKDLVPSDVIPEP